MEKANYDPLPVPSSAAPEDFDLTMQLELVYLQCSPAMKSMESQRLEVYENLDENKFEDSMDHAMKLASRFGSPNVRDLTDEHEQRRQHCGDALKRSTLDIGSLSAATQFSMNKFWPALFLTGVRLV